MSTTTSRMLRAAGASMLLLLAFPAVAEAQIGGMLKKARDKAVEKAVEKKVDEAMGGSNSRSGAARDDSPACRNVTFDRTTVELTGARLDGILKALKEVDATPMGAKRRELAQQRDAAEARLQELDNDESLHRAEESQREWKSCRSDAYQEIMNAKMEKEGAALSPKYMKAMREHQERVSAAQMKGDSAKAAAIQDSLWYVLTTVVAPTAADSQAVEKKCGKPPRASRRVAERDSLRVVVRELNDEIRALEEDQEDAMLKASGMTATQLAMARERLTMYVREGRACGFTKGEMDAINARKAELEKLL